MIDFTTFCICFALVLMGMVIGGMTQASIGRKDRKIAYRSGYSAGFGNSDLEGYNRMADEAYWAGVEGKIAGSMYSAPGKYKEVSFHKINSDSHTYYLNH